VFAVAITQLVSSIEDEAKGLAADLGITPYDARLVLNAGLPAIVLTTPQRDRAAALMTKIEGRGNGVMVVDSDTVVASGDMIALRRFRFEPNAITTDDRPDLRLPHEDVFAILRASHRQLIETRTESTTTKFSAGRAILSGGMMMNTKVKTESTSKLEEREQVLYLFRRSGETPWILRETSTNYAGLGSALGPSRAVNFGATMRMLRAQMPMAAYDERLVSAKRIGEKVSTRGTTESGKSTSASSEAGVDLLAHILAHWIARSAGIPYRA
jgi:hypothetical protein